MGNADYDRRHGGVWRPDQARSPHMTTGLSRTSRGLAFGGIMGRAAVLTPLAMALWWFVLKGASLWLLRLVAYLPLGLLVAPAGLDPVTISPTTGEWLFNVAVNTVGKDLRTGKSQYIDSLEFAVGEDSVAFFACGWFSYLALALSAAAFSGRRQTKRVLLGVGLQTSINILSLAAYVYINGYGVVINTPNTTGTLMWLFNYLYHIIYLVVPFAGPFMVALLVHPEWREYFKLPVQRP
ncbi:MAG TPA: hypothetical protein VN442_00500 [Bryobacteraceae bacterium]|nr:hypothetical protein [Bryobacteraceae bacterium]